jgi:glycosyltransferase involved in cell wall biosynthesis
MKILILSQVFYPDTVSVSQHISDLAFKLTEEGNTVTVFTSRYPYEDKNKIYKSTDLINGVEIHRLIQTSFGKSNIFSRIVDFFSFYCSISFRLIFINRNNYDVIIGSTVPPLLSLMGILIAKWKRMKFVYWIMDLQPELSISSGLIKEHSFVARLFTLFGNYIIKHSDRIISLDRFMTSYLISRGAKENSISTIPVWPVMDEKFNGDRMSNPFRVQNNFGDKIVVMYSGNHAYVHPLDTLLEAALKIRENSKVLFVFVGGGVRKKDVTEFKNNYHLNNIIQLPFQPRENIHNSLGSSDIQVVILGDGQVGYTHPNKVYGALYVAKPILYIGPKKSHVSDILDKLSGNIFVEHGQIDSLVFELEQFSKLGSDVVEIIGNDNRKYAELNFHPDSLKTKMVEAVVNI